MRVQQPVSFNTKQELENAKAEIPAGVSFSDYVREKAFGLAPRGRRAGAPEGNENWRGNARRKEKSADK